MKAIIPVAGAGTRLKPFTATVPKPLLPVAGKPILAHLMDNLDDFGIEQFILIIGYLGDKIKEFVERKYPGKAIFVEQEKLLGLGYAVKLGLQQCNNEPVIVALGDTIIETDMTEMSTNSGNIIGVHRVTNPQRFGIVELSDNKIISMEEKPSQPKSNMAIAGFYLFQNSDVISETLGRLVERGIKTRGEYQLTDAMRLMLEEGQIFYAKEIQGWHDCGTVSTLIATNKHLLKKVKIPQAEESVVFIPPVYLGKGAQIKRSIIGPNVSVGDGTTIEDSIITNTILGDKTSVENAHLRNSILGNESAYTGRWAKMILGDHSEGGYYNEF
ncbi:NTP transferase domain-containing protein [bacterium]|nr:NTP transferase domain-containing protein [bacterium]